MIEDLLVVSSIDVMRDARGRCIAKWTIAHEAHRVTGSGERTKALLERVEECRTSTRLGLYGIKIGRD